MTRLLLVGKMWLDKVISGLKATYFNNIANVYGGLV